MHLKLNTFEADLIFAPNFLFPSQVVSPNLQHPNRKCRSQLSFVLGIPSVLRSIWDASLASLVSLLLQALLSSAPAPAISQLDCVYGTPAELPALGLPELVHTVSPVTVCT